MSTETTRSAAQENVTETALAKKGTLRWCLEDQSSPYVGRLKYLLGDRMPYFNASLINLAYSARGFDLVRPGSLISAGIIAVTLDFPIDRNLGFAWIIPYGELAQFQIGYKGFVQLALRSGRYAGMNAVSINDEALGGFDPIGDPIIHWEAVDETKPAIGYAYAWRLTTGFTKIVYWPKTKVEAHALRYSQAYKQQKRDSPWFTDFDKMALKTVVKSGISKWGIMSVEDRMQLALERDQSAAIDVDAPPIYPDAEPPATSPNGPTGPAGEAGTPATLNDLTEKLQQPDAESTGNEVAGTVTPAGSVIDVAAQVLKETPHLTLVQEVEAVTEPSMTLDEMPARLQLAQHVADVRALEMLWAGPKVKRSDAEKEPIKKMCGARIEEMRLAARKGKK